MKEIKLEDLRSILPDNWVEEVMKLVPYKETKIRGVLRDPKPKDKNIVEAIIRVAEIHKANLERESLIQTQKIAQLLSS